MTTASVAVRASDPAEFRESVRRCVAIKRGKNSGWHRPDRVIAATRDDSPTEFERQAQRLGLAPGQYAGSEALRRWVRKYKNVRYVPETLLAEWGFRVDESGGLAL